MREEVKSQWTAFLTTAETTKATISPETIRTIARTTINQETIKTTIRATARTNQIRTAKIVRARTQEKTTLITTTIDKASNKLLLRKIAI